MFLSIISVIYFAGSLLSASRRPLFFDEIVTTFLGDLPRITSIWPLIGQGIELNPPLPFWLAWVQQHTLGGGEVLGRLPALIGFWMMCITLYHFIRKNCGPVFGIIAFLFPIFTYVCFDSAVIRGYGLMLGFYGGALLCWQLACAGVRRPLTLPGLALCIAGAVSCHYYALYLAGTIALGELTRTWSRKRADPSIWIATLAGLTPLYFYAALIKSAAAGALKNFWVTPSPKFLYDSYSDMLGGVTLVFLIFLVTMIWPRVEKELPTWTTPVSPLHEIVAAAALAAMPLAVYVAALFGQAPFFNRYVQPVVLGYTIIITLFAHRIGGSNPRFQRFLVTGLFSLCLLPWGLFQVAKFFVLPAPSQVNLKRLELPRNTTLPIVFDNEAEFLEYYYYAPPDLKKNIFHLINLPAAVKFRGSDTGQRSLKILQSFHEVGCVDYHEFLARHPKFLVTRVRQEGWVIQSLLADGAKVRLASLKKELGYFVEGNFLFEVTLPEK